MKNRLTVLVIDEDKERASLLEQALRDQGYEVLGRLESTDFMADHVDELKPDIIIIDLDSPDRDVLENMALMNHNCPRPVIMFAEQGDQATIEKAIRSGVSAYVVDGLEQHRIKAILDVAIARFREFQAIRSELNHVHGELNQARTELADRNLTEKAKLLIMKHNHCTENKAHQAMRKMAMDQQKPLIEVAKSIISVLELLP